MSSSFLGIYLPLCSHTSPEVAPCCIQAPADNVAARIIAQIHEISYQSGYPLSVSQLAFPGRGSAEVHQKAIGLRRWPLGWSTVDLVRDRMLIAPQW